MPAPSNRITPYVWLKTIRIENACIADSTTIIECHTADVRKNFSKPMQLKTTNINKWSNAKSYFLRKVHNSVTIFYE